MDPEYRRLTTLDIDSLREALDEYGMFWDPEMDREQLLRRYLFYRETMYPSPRIQLVRGPYLRN